MKQRLYAALVALGASILLYRTIMMLFQGAVGVLVFWVSVLLIAEFLLDLGCLITSVIWLVKNDKSKARIPLRLVSIAILLHAVRVLIFVLGRVGPWIDFDLRPEQRELHYTRWTMNEVYVAAILTAMGIIGVLIIWFILRHKKKQ